LCGDVGEGGDLKVTVQAGTALPPETVTALEVMQLEEFQEVGNG